MCAALRLPARARPAAPGVPGVNHKRVYRLYSAANLAVRKRKKVKRPGCRAHAAEHRHQSQRGVEHGLRQRQPGQRTAPEVPDRGRRLQPRGVDIAVDYGISGQYVTRLLDQAALFRGYPAAVRTDNGPEFTSRAFIAWAQATASGTS
jgi:putative transposase